MNHLVILDTQAGELERILSGVKTMLVKECDPARTAAYPVSPGDSLYFLRDKDDCAVRVKATVVRVLVCIESLAEGMPQILKEMQPRLQFTEDQFNDWSTRKQALLVEFASAHKIVMFHVAPKKVTHRADWIAFEDADLVESSVAGPTRAGAS